MTVRETTLTLAVACPALGLLASIAHAGGWLSDQGFLYRFQTLIGAGVAILVALIAVVPVWRQLTSMRVQTGTIYRQFLKEQIDGMDQRRRGLFDRIGKFLEPAERRLYEDSEFGDGRVNPHWAFEQEQIARGLISELAAYLVHLRDPAEIDRRLQTVISTLTLFEERCGTIHFTDSHEQSDEDHDISDEAWARLIEEGVQAEEQLSGDLSGVRKAVDELRSAFDREIEIKRLALRNLDRSLIQARI